MPFPFTLPTTSSFSFSAYFNSESHPSLPLSASTYRGVLRDALKKHKRLPPSDQAPHLASVLLSLNNYIPYLLAIDEGLSSKDSPNVVLKSTPSLEWRPTLSDGKIPGRESTRLKISSLEYEVYFVLSSLAYTYTLLSRVSLYPLYTSTTASPSPEQRTLAITTATKHLLQAASIHDYLATRSDQIATTPPCVDITKSTFKALSSLAMAEATLLAVLKDDPYPAAIAQDRNKNDKEWMIKAPEIPKVRAHLFARLCLAVGEHAGNALSLLNAASKGEGKIDSVLLRYVEDLRRTGRGKACRFFAIDSELGGQTGTALAWLQAGMNELGLASSEEARKGLSFGKFKKGWEEKREEKRVEKGSQWGADAGRMEEARVLEMLEKKWAKMNDTINTQIVPPIGPLMALMPSGREVYSLKLYSLPALDPLGLENMKAPPDCADDHGHDTSDEEKEDKAPAGAFPGTQADYTTGGRYY